MRKYLPYGVLVILIFLNIFIWVKVHSFGNQNLEVTFLDVGQGDAIFIEAPNGNQVLIDAGRDVKILRQLSKLIPFYDREIDLLISTHPDSDHIGGMPEIIERFNVEMYLHSGKESESDIYKELLEKLEEKEVGQMLARRGMRINLSEEVALDVLFPDRDVSGLDANDASVIAKLTYGETEVMLTGDSSKKIEEYLVSQYGERLESDILKAGHHGSKTSSATAFLGVTDPDFAVVSAEKDSRYGHPHKEVLDSFENFEIEVLNTADLGNITFVSDGTSFYIK